MFDPRQLRALGGLAGATMLLAGLYVFAPSGRTAPEGQIVEAFSLADVRSVVLERRVDDREERIRLEQRDGIWWVVEPFEAEADPDMVFGVLDAMGTLPPARRVDGALLADVGLEPPRVEAVVEMADGGRRVLVVGRKAPVGVQTYVLHDGAVAVVDGHPADLLTKRAAEYRDHKVFRFAPGDVARVSVESALGLLEATKTSDGWFLTNYGPVDLDALDDWLVDLTRLRVDLFLDLDHETIDEARFTVEVQTQDGRVQRLLVGRDTPYGPLVFYGDGLDGVVDPQLLAMLERGPTDVGRSAVFPFSLEHTTSVELVGRRSLLPPYDAGDPVVQSLRDAQYTYRRDVPEWTTSELTVVVAGRRGARFDIGPVDDEGFRPVRQQGAATAVRVPAGELGPLFDVPPT